MPRIRIEVDGYLWARCGHEWMPRDELPRVCPKCKSPFWDRQRRLATYRIDAQLSVRARIDARPEQARFYGATARCSGSREERRAATRGSTIRTRRSGFLPPASPQRGQREDRRESHDRWPSARARAAQTGYWFEIRTTRRVTD